MSFHLGNRDAAADRNILKERTLWVIKSREMIFFAEAGGSQ
jgi:hypothetical protein